MLTWNPTDVLSCLGVLPTEEEDGISHAYSVAKDGMRLDLTVFQYDGDVYITLSREGVEAPVVDF
ncbi:MAG: Ypar14, superfamily integron cassette, partial [Planctomycetota bacterium]